MNKKTRKIRINRTNRTNRKTKNSRVKKTNKNKSHDMFEFINVGSTNTIIKDNNIVTNNKMEWNGKYDGITANIHISVDENGNKQNMNIKLDNNDLLKLLRYPSIDKQLDERIMDDFYKSALLVK